MFKLFIKKELCELEQAVHKNLVNCHRIRQAKQRLLALGKRTLVTPEGLFGCFTAGILVQKKIDLSENWSLNNINWTALTPMLVRYVFNHWQS